MMERTRVIEIIEAYGGHSAAWPDDERAAAAALAAGDFSLTRMIEEARALDRGLRDWAHELLPTTIEAADRAALRALATVKAQTQRRWLPRTALGGALAASLAIGVLLSRPESPRPATPAAQIAMRGLPGENAAAAQDMLVWSSVFTPTPEEEAML